MYKSIHHEQLCKHMSLQPTPLHFCEIVLARFGKTTLYKIARVSCNCTRLSPICAAKAAHGPLPHMSLTFKIVASYTRTINTYKQT